MADRVDRREFLGRLASGTAVLTLPGFLASCGVQQATSMTRPLPVNPALEWFGIDETTCARVMAELTAKGADIADLYFQHARRNTLALEDGTLADATSGIDQGVGLRVVAGGLTGYSFTEDLTLPAMLAAARTASTIATGTAIEVPKSLAQSPEGDLYRTTVPWSEVGVDRKLPILQSVEALAKSMDPAVEKVSAYWVDGEERITIATLDGRLVTDHRPMTRLTVLVTAKKGGQVQTGFSNISAREDIGWYTDERLTAIVREAVDRTLILFEARRPPAGEMPVILSSGASGILLHEAIGHGMEADFNRTGLSVYSDMMGKKVAEPSVTIVDQATIPHERGALNYDDEGVGTGRTVLVEDGILTSYLHDLKTAMEYGTASTGSGRRQSYKFPPLPRMSCTFMEAGPHERDEIIAAVDRGIVCETYTNGRVQIGAGDYTFSVKNAWLVERGKITAPIKDALIRGNGPDTLTRITMVGDDARFDTGGWTCGKDGQNVPVSQGIPTVLVSSLSVGVESSA